MPTGIIAAIFEVVAAKMLMRRLRARFSIEALNCGQIEFVLVGCDKSEREEVRKLPEARVVEAASNAGIICMRQPWKKPIRICCVGAAVSPSALPTRYASLLYGTRPYAGYWDRDCRAAFVRVCKGSFSHTALHEFWHGLFAYELRNRSVPIVLEEAVVRALERTLGFTSLGYELVSPSRAPQVLISYLERNPYRFKSIKKLLTLNGKVWTELESTEDQLATLWQIDAFLSCWLANSHLPMPHKHLFARLMHCWPAPDPILYFIANECSMTQDQYERVYREMILNGSWHPLTL